MVAPIVQWFNSLDTVEFNSNNPLDLGSVDPGVTGSPTTINIWNNKGGAADVSDMTDVRLTTVTKNGYVAGDSGPTGNESAYGRYVVEDAYIHAKKNSETTYSPIGGVVTKALDNIRGGRLTAPDVVTGTPSQSSNGHMTNNTYYYVVVAYDETGETSRSQQTNPVTVGGGNNQVLVEWDEVEGAVGYKIFRLTSSWDTTQDPDPSSQVGTVVGDTEYMDTAAQTSLGVPGANTCTYGHKRTVQVLPVIPTDADVGQVEFNMRLLYKYS